MAAEYVVVLTIAFRLLTFDYGRYMWRKKEKNRRNGLNTGDVLHLAAFSAKSRRNKIFLFRVAAALFVAVAGLISFGILVWLGAQSIGQYLFFQNDLFRLRAIKIECDGEVLTPKHISEYLALNNCSNLFAFNMAEERTALLKKVPRIKDVKFTRRLPGELTIMIRERLPVARLEMGAYYLTIDREGRVLGTSSGSKNLPVISGHKWSGLRPGVQLDDKKITRALETLTVCDTTPVGNYVKIKTIDVDKTDVLDITLSDGEKVKLSWTDMDRPSTASRESLERKLTRLAESLKSAAARGKKIAVIDMTVENNFPAREY